MKKNKYIIYLVAGIPLIIIGIIFFIKHTYEKYFNSFIGQTVCYYPRKKNPFFITMKKVKNNEVIEDLIFIKVFKSWYEYDFINKNGFFVDNVEFNKNEELIDSHKPIDDLNINKKPDEK